MRRIFIFHASKQKGVNLNHSKCRIDFHFPLLWMLLLLFKSEIRISFLISLTLQLSDGNMIWYTLYILNYLPRVITSPRASDSCLLITLLSKYLHGVAKIYFPILEYSHYFKGDFKTLNIKRNVSSFSQRKNWRKRWIIFFDLV